MPLKLTGATTGSLTIDATANGGDIVFSGNISDLTGIDFTTSASSGDLLSYNGTNWVPLATPHTLTLAGLTGDVDLTTSVPVNGDYLYYDGGSSKWVKKDLMTAVVALDTAQTLGSLAGVDLITLAPSAGDYLTFDANSEWVTTPAPSYSLLDLTDVGVDGANGEVLTTDGNGSFTFTAISGGGSNVTALDDLSDVVASTPANGEYLQYNGNNWVPASASTPTSIAGTMTGHVIPDTDDVYDIGSASYKIRDMYVSDNSLWVGDDHKVSVEGGKMKFRKRKGTKQIPPVIDALVLADNPGTNSQERITIVIAAIDPLFPSHTITQLSHIKLRMWVAYLKTFAGHENDTIQDVFRNQDDDYEPDQINSGTHDSYVKQNGTTHKQHYMNSNGLQPWTSSNTSVKYFDRSAAEEVALPNDEDWIATTVPTGIWSVHYTKKECVNYTISEFQGMPKRVYSRIVDTTQSSYNATYPNQGTYDGSWMDEVSCEADKHTWNGSTCSIDLSLAPEMLASMDEAKCLALSVRKWDDIFLGLLPDVNNTQALDGNLQEYLDHPGMSNIPMMSDLISGSMNDHFNITHDIPLNVPAGAEGIWINSWGGKDPVLKKRISKTASATRYDVENIQTMINKPMHNKNIWWIGTSIPATGGYVGLIEEKLGAKIANVAVGASRMRRGRSYPSSAYNANSHNNWDTIFPDHHVWDGSSCSDGVTTNEVDCIAKPHDYIKDIPYIGHIKSALYSVAEKADMWDNWDTYWDDLQYDYARTAPWAPECIVNHVWDSGASSCSDGVSTTEASCIAEHGLLDANIKREKVCTDTSGGVWTPVASKCTDGIHVWDSGASSCSDGVSTTEAACKAACEAQDFMKTSDPTQSNGKHKWLGGFSNNDWKNSIKISMKTSYNICLDPFLDKDAMGTELPDVFVIDHAFNDRGISPSDEDWERFDPNDPTATNRNTFRGSVNWLINHIRASLPRAVIIMISHHNKAEPKELSIVNLQKQIAEDRCIPFLDLSSKMGLTLHKVPNTAHLWNVEPWKAEGAKSNNHWETGTCSDTSITTKSACESASDTWTPKDMTELRFHIADTIHPSKDRTHFIQNKIAHYCADFINENTNWRETGNVDKIVCTAMNEQYGFGSFRNAIWLNYSKEHMTSYHEKGYHAIFKPWVDAMYKDTWYSPFLTKWGEGLARRRSADIYAEMKGKKKRNIRARIERFILEPLCYVVGKLSN